MTFWSRFKQKVAKEINDGITILEGTDDDKIQQILKQKKDKTNTQATQKELTQKVLAMKYAVFGKKTYMTLRGQDIRGLHNFYYLTKQIIIAPPMVSEGNPYDYPDSTHIEIAGEEKKNDEETGHSEALESVASYLNDVHEGDYIMYNLSERKSLDGNTLLNQVMDYPFPTCQLHGHSPESVQINGTHHTCPPNLDSLFLVAIEIKAWIAGSPEHVVVIHQQDECSSNPTLLLSCLLALQNREAFVQGAEDALPWVQRMAGKKKWTNLSETQKIYLGYFDQVLLKGFIPLSKPLILSKIILVNTAPEPSRRESTLDEISEVIEDPTEFAKDLYFVVTQGRTVVFNQLDNAEKDLSGNVLAGLGEVLLEVDSQVSEDFQIKCIRYGQIEEHIGQTCCLHAAFIEHNFVRIQLSDTLQLDIIFKDANQQQQQLPVQGSVSMKVQDAEDSSESDSAPENTPKDTKKEEKKENLIQAQELKKSLKEEPSASNAHAISASDNKNEFWMALSQQILHVELEQAAAEVPDISEPVNENYDVEYYDDEEEEAEGEEEDDLNNDYFEVEYDNEEEKAKSEDEDKEEEDKSDEEKVQAKNVFCIESPSEDSKTGLEVLEREYTGGSEDSLERSNPSLDMLNDSSEMPTAATAAENQQPSTEVKNKIDVLLKPSSKQEAEKEDSQKLVQEVFQLQETDKSIEEEPVAAESPTIEVAGAEVVKTAAKSKNVANDASDAGKNEKGENSSDGGEDEDEDYDKYLDNLEQGLDDSD